MQVYCDNAATTKPYPEVIDVMSRAMVDVYGNPSSEHGCGRAAAGALQKARHQIAVLLGASDNEIYFTSGASEANNWVLRGAAECAKKNYKPYIIVSEFEHHSVLNTIDKIIENGVTPLYVRPDKDGYIDPADIENLLEKHKGMVSLVSVMMVNNEIGTIQPIVQIADVCHKYGVLFHTDATQAVGHIQVDVNCYGMDLMSWSGHKFHGPKGVGGLYINSNVALPNLIYGGLQENGRRAGTENVPGAIGMAIALDTSVSNTLFYYNKLVRIRDWIAKELCEDSSVRLNGSLDCHVPGILNFTFDGIEGESMVLMLDTYGICASAGAACSTGTLEPSHVLRAIGLTREQAMCSVRLSFDIGFTFEEAEYVVSTIKKCAAILRCA